VQTNNDDRIRYLDVSLRPAPHGTYETWLISKIEGSPQLELIVTRTSVRVTGKWGPATDRAITSYSENVEFRHGNFDGDGVVDALVAPKRFDAALSVPGAAGFDITILRSLKDGRIGQILDLPLIPTTDLLLPLPFWTATNVVDYNQDGLDDFIFGTTYHLGKIVYIQNESE